VTFRSLDAASVASEIDAKGARTVVSQLYGDGTYSLVLDHIAAGEDEWVALAPRLAPGTDASTAEGLTIAMAEALPRNPAAVLTRIEFARGTLSSERVCGVPFIEGTPVDVPAYIRSAEAAVSAIRIPQLQAVKATCISALHG
jgi:hypothetical protein